MSEEVGEGEFLVLQVHDGDQEALDEVPGLPPRKVVRGATLEGGQGKVHRLYREQGIIGNIKTKASWEILNSYIHGKYQTAIHHGKYKMTRHSSPKWSLMNFKSLAK